jgi:hypothetical protein
LTAWVDPPGPLDPELPQPAATAISAHTLALSTTFLIPSLLFVGPCDPARKPGVRVFATGGILTETPVKNK